MVDRFEVGHNGLLSSQSSSRWAYWTTTKGLSLQELIRMRLCFLLRIARWAGFDGYAGTANALGIVGPVPALPGRKRGRPRGKKVSTDFPVPWSRKVPRNHLAIVYVNYQCFRCTSVAVCAL
jgi:hypothetical protein